MNLNNLKIFLQIVKGLKNKTVLIDNSTQLHYYLDANDFCIGHTEFQFLMQQQNKMAQS